AFQLALCRLLQRFIIALKETMRVKPVAGIEKVKVEIVAERIVALDDLLVGAADRCQKAVDQKARRRRNAQAVGELPAHLQDREHVPFQVEIAIQIGLAQGKLAMRTT